MTLGSQMLIAGGKAQNVEEAMEMLQEALSSGAALEKLAEFVEAQGGDKRAVYDTDLLPKASIVEPVYSPESGYISHIACAEVGICSLILGGGRENKESEIDLSVGIVLTKKVCDKVEKGDVLAYIHANAAEKLAVAKERFLKAYSFTDNLPEKMKMIKHIL